MTFTSGPLNGSHDLSRFACSVSELDNWLRNSALQAQKLGTARSWVWTRDGSVVAYYVLAPHKVVCDEMPSAVAHGAPNEIPAILLAKLALDHSLHGQGWGGALLADALTVAITAMQKVGGRLIVVDAINDHAAAFYAAHGFKTIPDGNYRLIMKASTAAKSLGLDWP